MYAVITGASSGLGREFSYILSDKGYDLILVSRREEILLDMKKELEKKGSKVICIILDLSIYDSYRILFEEISEYDVELFINNAGAGLLGNFHEVDIEKLNNIVMLNITAVQNLTRLFIDNYDKGRLINIGSLAGCLPTPNHAVYSATKAFVNNFSRAINYELKKNKKNIRIYTALPGPVKTNFSTNANAKINRGMSAFKCASLIIAGASRKKDVIIPGFKFKMIYLLSKILPVKLLMIAAYKIQKKK